MLFCDTSTMAKYYVLEAESVAVQSRLDADDMVVASQLARAELMAVFHRRLRERIWSKNEFEAVTRQFSRDDIGGYWSWVSIDTAVVDQAVKVYLTLPGKVFLRASDCVHLVTALHYGFAEIYTHDRHQISAASALGLNPLTIR